MIIGASPGSTGGGIKTTTFTVVLLHIWSTIRGRRDTVIFKKRVPEILVSRALVIMALAVLYVTFITFVVEDIEHTGFLSTMFEVVSAFGTVGLSVGNGDSLSLVATFSPMSKIIIIVTMLVGRLGPLTLFMALLRQHEERIRYPEGRLMIG
jgi:trk system potassium uptake protein TrkH